MSATTLEKPLTDPVRLERTPDPCAMVIFGASGDLTKRKLLPAVYTLFKERLVPPNFSVVGFSRSPMSDDEFRSKMREGVEEFGGPVDAATWQKFAAGLRYISAHPHHPEEYAKLTAVLSELDRERGTGGNRVYYLAVPPSSFQPIVRNLQSAGLAESEKGWARRHHREAFWARPGKREGIEPRVGQRVSRRAGLPHRSLPGQRDGAEPAGVSLCQRHLRAHLEPALRGPRADHRGGDAGGREPRLLLRGSRGAARHGAEPHAAIADHDGDGTARLVRSGQRCARRS